MENRGAETPTRRALSLQEHHWGSSALSFVSREIGPNTLRHSVSPLAPRAFTHASLATVNTRTRIRQAASDLAIHRGLSRTMTLTRELGITLQSAAQHANVVAHLAWRKQNSGPCGRALAADIPALGLKKHDRLEPWTGLQYIGDEFDQLQPTAARPVRVCLWRRSEETATRHRSPLLDTVAAHEREFFDDRGSLEFTKGFSAGSGGECSRVTCFGSVWPALKL